MYLRDTNIILEFLLDQTKADEVEQLFLHIPSEHLYRSEFSLYSIGLVLLRRKLYDSFLSFIEDLLITGGVGLVRLSVEDIKTAFVKH
uniref:PIN domain-containing protein n=1 Tax=candidate division WOR-3 bacterium TaxID=2052148 RepID=A0A7C6EBX0_UNCW3